MNERTGSRIDGAGWLLFACGLMVALAVLSHEPARGLDASRTNLLGVPGDWLANELCATLGTAVHVFLAAWFVLVLMLLVRRNWAVWLARLTGWLILLPATALTFDWFGNDVLPTPVHGAGGILGAFLNHVWEQHLPNLLGIVVLLTLWTVGLFLAADFVLRGIFQVFFLAFLPVSWFYAIVSGNLTAWRERRRQQTDVVEINVGDIPIHHVEPVVPPAPPAEETKTPAIRITRTPEPVIEEAPNFDNFELPPITLLEDPAPFPFEAHDQKLREQAVLLEKTLQDFDLKIRVVAINTGPVVTQYELALETGLRVNKITVLGDDLALHLKVPSVRIVAPIPGKNTVGIEVPNENRAIVRLKELIAISGRKLQKTKIPLFLGKDTEGRPLVLDLADLPHVLIAGTTGTGKSVCMNSIILSMLMTRRPDEVKLIMIDPKGNEMMDYNKLPHMMHPVLAGDRQMKKAEAVLGWAVEKMEERYELLGRARVRNVAAYNELGTAELRKRLQVSTEEDDERVIPEKMPYIVIVVDELADLMMTMKREVETHIIRLAQKSRAAGIHLVLATQKPTVDVITGLIKSNLPGRICFRVASRTDSRVVLDEMGADKLLGKGDMLFLQPGTSMLLRAQGTFASDQEIQKVVQHLETDEPCYAIELMQLKTSADAGNVEEMKKKDDLYEQAVEIIVSEGRGSVSLLQRALGIGYGRAARLIDFMAEDGIVGSYNGSNAREVLYSPEEWEAAKAGHRQAVNA